MEETEWKETKEGMEKGTDRKNRIEKEKKKQVCEGYPRK